jgi:hypothetical protein
MCTAEDKMFSVGPFPATDVIALTFNILLQPHFAEMLQSKKKKSHPLSLCLSVTRGSQGLGMFSYLVMSSCITKAIR